ncbi:MAG: hypothetical protein HY257_12785 [Chloroflexi bacterium]|nr:hypothetical protein [Chloroflexota bacterium]
MQESIPTSAYPSTLFDDFTKLTRIDGRLALAVIGASAIVFYIGAALLDSVVVRVFESDFWRPILLQPAISFYILVLQHFLRSSRIAVMEEFRKMMNLDRAAFQNLIDQISPLTRRREWIALALGAAIGVAIPLDWNIPDQFRWTNLYVLTSTWVMFALAGWGAYSTSAITQLLNRLHRQKLDVNIFRPTFLDAMARRSFGVTLVFIGAITISLLFIPAQSVRNFIYFVAIYAALSAMTVAIFLLNMLETHRLMVRTKKRELEIVRGHLADDYRRLKERHAAGDHDVDAKHVSAWLAYEKRILDAPEWAFNPQTIRNLAVSMFVPIGTAIGRVLAERF